MFTTHNYFTNEKKIALLPPTFISSLSVNLSKLSSLYILQEVLRVVESLYQLTTYIADSLAAQDGYD